MAKTSAQKKRPNTTRPPVKARGGRPAGLFTWLAVGLVVIVVAALVIIKVASGGTTKTGSSSFSPISAANLTALTTVPASVFNTVGVTSPIAAVTAPQAVAGQPELTGTNDAGATVPEILYIGAEYCPYCAFERWGMIVSLSRFGSFSGLRTIHSSSTDAYPNTPTWTFYKSTYASKYLTFTPVEETTNVPDKNSPTGYVPLQTPTPAQQALLSKYNPGGSIPFVNFGNKYVITGASALPSVLAGKSWATIAAELSDASSPVAQAVNGTANFMTAAICKMTSNQPASVCTPSVTGLQAKMASASGS